MMTNQQREAEALLIQAKRTMQDYWKEYLQGTTGGSVTREAMEYMGAIEQLIRMTQQASNQSDRKVA